MTLGSAKKNYGVLPMAIEHNEPNHRKKDRTIQSHK
jgi:hypothetical protein